MTNCTVVNCPTGLEEFETVAAHVRECINRHRQAADHMAGHLREGVSWIADHFPKGATKRNAAMREIEKVVEMSKVVEAKFESLFTLYGAGRPW